MLRVCFVLVLFLVPIVGFAQMQNNIWYLGFGNFVNFNTRPPTISYISDKKVRATLFQVESDAPNSVVSDTNGSLLYISNGYTVFDSSFQIMQGSESLEISNFSPMPCVSAKIPGEVNQYYLFSLKNGFVSYGSDYSIKYLPGELYFSIIDMGLNNGKGGMLEDKKFVKLYSGLVGKLVLVRGVCGSIWLLSHEMNSNRYVAFEIDDKGIHEPVFSDVGSYIVGTNMTYKTLLPEGSLSVSLDQSRILTCGGKDNFAELFSFNKNTGKLEFLASLEVAQDSLSQSFGCFSPDGSKVYIGETAHPLSASQYDTSTLYYQYNVNVLNQDSILRSKQFIEKGFGVGLRSHMVIGPDGLVYISNSRKLSAILRPNETAQLCQFVDRFYLENPDIKIVSGFSYSLNNPLVLPDPPSSKDSTFLVADTLLCAGDAIRMDLGSLGDRFLWQDGSTDSLYTITKPGKYWAQIERGNCTFYDTMVVEPKWVEGLDIPQDTLLCPGDSIVISLPGDFDFRWQDGSLENPYSIRQAGTYWVAIQDSGCVVQDTTIVQEVSFQPVLPDDLSLCEGETLELDIPYDIVGWDDGSINPHHILDGPGVYWLDYLDQGCLFRDSMQVVAGYCEDCRVYVPNIFSPNGDGHNDVLAIQTNCTLSTFSWQIWDRWGTLVFSTRDPSASWDGRVGQSMAPVGVYVFRMNGLTPNGEVRDQGTITLIR